jgi:hypothetical protein
MRFASAAADETVAYSAEKPSWTRTHAEVREGMGESGGEHVCGKGEDSLREGRQGVAGGGRKNGRRRERRESGSGENVPIFDVHIKISRAAWWVSVRYGKQTYVWGRGALSRLHRLAAPEVAAVTLEIHPDL